MAATQTTIQFKARKLRCYAKASVKSKRNDENINITNANTKKANKQLKRRAASEKPYYSDSGSDEESCSPTKIVRLANKPVPEENEIETSSDCSQYALKELPSRETEIARLKKFLGDHLANETSGSLYVSGQPGTGKTACLSYILKLPEFKAGYKEVYVNCTMMKSAGSIYLRICSELKLHTTASTEKACLSAIERYLSKPHKMTLLVLDEIDQLDSKKQSVLYTIFEWASRPSARLVLVGVANALDLTERVLPRLQARRLSPELMHFPPYTKQQIVNVFTQTLASGKNKNLFSPVALQMLAAKIAAISGDMRRALDIGRRVIELANRNQFASKPNVESLMQDKSVTVELKQVLEVLSDVYGSSQKLSDDVDEESFPMQQKLLICSLMLMLTKGKIKDIVVGKLYDVYKRVASSRNIVAVDSAEFYSLCSLVESRGMIRLVGRKEPRSQKVSLQWDQAEVSAALRDKTLMADIMNDVKCLAR